MKLNANAPSIHAPVVLKRYTFRIHLGHKGKFTTVTHSGTSMDDAREIALCALKDADKERVTQVTCIAEAA